MDFYQIRTRETKNNTEIYPDFIVGRSKDLMVQGRTFYAIWDEEAGLWSRDEYDVQRMVDADLSLVATNWKLEHGKDPIVKYMSSFKSTSWAEFNRYVGSLADNFHPLDNKVIFANTEVKKSDYASRKLPYAYGPGDTSAWDELLSTLYSSGERSKIEWAIGAVVAGDSKRIQKFLVFYGPAGTGKSTVLNIVGELFAGYTTTFDGKALGSNNAAFATEVFKHNPLVAIQHDGDLSKIEDNTRLNSIIAHESMTMNEKYKASYTSRVDAFLFMGSNQPVRISDAKSGIIRRLIDVNPTGVKLPVHHYQNLIKKVSFELGAIAHKCYERFLEMGPNHYMGYRPMEMMLQTDVFFNYVEAYYDIFKAQDQITLDQAYALYKEFCEESGIVRPLAKYKMREELRNYFEEFHDRGEIDGKRVRSVYVGFTAEKYKQPSDEANVFSLVLDRETSLLDELLCARPAQMAKPDGTPSQRWEKVRTTLVDLDTSQTHYVKLPENHIVIDFDLKDLNGHKALQRNLEAASSWPATYAEISQGGGGIHLHYLYSGDASLLSPQYSAGIEVKVFAGDAALRRRLSRCNGVPVSVISSGLPLKEKKEKMLTEKTIKSEKSLREMIRKNLEKEYHPGTKPSVDFIKKILDDAYADGLVYDVSDMRSQILAFANNSTNQAGVCVKTVSQMRFSSEKEQDAEPEAETSDDRLAFFDVEVYPNLFVVCWKFQGSDTITRMINPKPREVEELFRLKLVGFYNRRYDNHILYAASLGYTPERLFKLSQKMIVDNNRNVTFAQAYSISYADIWDFSTKKQSLKKFEVDLGILHMELDIPWDEPVPEEQWQMVVDYCANDVTATEATFEDRKGDWTARLILAELSGMTPNDTTQRHTAKIIFGDDPKPQDKFVYTDLSTQFPGYRFELGKSSYKGEDPSEGGYVYAEPGIYHNVAVLDVASMHPTSIRELNLFGPYTEKFGDLVDARVAIKRQEYENARSMLDGRMRQFLVDAETDPDSAQRLAYALKIVINIVYGLTSAKFDNPFRDLRNVDNIVAKRGALFMIDLKEMVQSKGYTVAHIKTDSIKIPDADQDIIDLVKEFGIQYGYDFEHETTYGEFCLVNDAVYVARETVAEDGDVKDEWTAVGAQFQHPFVYKTLFSGEDYVFEDYVESRSVQKGRMYLDLDPSQEEKELDKTKMRHIGRTGSFVPVLADGGVLYRVNDEEKYHAVAGTKGHLWIEAEVAKGRADLQIDMSYFNKLVDTATAAINQFGSLGYLVHDKKGEDGNDTTYQESGEFS